jgi:hypothetical protein
MGADVRQCVDMLRGQQVEKGFQGMIGMTNGKDCLSAFGCPIAHAENPPLRLPLSQQDPV